MIQRDEDFLKMRNFNKKKISFVIAFKNNVGNLAFSERKKRNQIN